MLEEAWSTDKMLFLGILRYCIARALASLGLKLKDTSSSLVFQLVVSNLA